MEAFFVSTLAIAVGEIGDKTQLLALVLAARFRRPLPIALGILAATALNHSVAGALGAWAGSWLEPAWLGWGLGLSFILLGIWMLFPDKLDAASDKPAPLGGYRGAFLVTLGSFFLAEIGDKTQIATVVLAARYDSPTVVVAGTTLGMLLADLPAVWLGSAATTRIPFAFVRMAAALLFVALGAAALASGVSFSFP